MTVPTQENLPYDPALCGSETDMEPLLYEYVSCEANEKTVSFVKEHLRSCAHCQRGEQRIRKMLQTLKDSAPVPQGSIAKDVMQRITEQNEALLAPIAGGISSVSAKIQPSRKARGLSRHTVQSIGAIAAAFAIVIGLVGITPFLTKVNNTNGTDAEQNGPSYQSPVEESSSDSVSDKTGNCSEESVLGGMDTSLGTSESTNTRSEVETQNDYMDSAPSPEQDAPALAPEEPPCEEAPSKAPADDTVIENENKAEDMPEPSEPTETIPFVKAVLYVDPQNETSVYEKLSEIDGLQMEKSDLGLVITPALAADTVFSVLDDAGLILSWSSLPFDTADAIRILWMVWIDESQQTPSEVPTDPTPNGPDAQTGSEQPIAPDTPIGSEVTIAPDASAGSDVPTVSVVEPVPSVAPTEPVDPTPSVTPVPAEPQDAEPSDGEASADSSTISNALPPDTDTAAVDGETVSTPIEEP